MLSDMVQSTRLVYAAVRRALGNVFFEKPAGIETAGIVRLHELGLSPRNRKDYHPTPWLSLKRVLPQEEVKDDDIFIDIGCGKGRMLYLAATYNFRKVIGVELAADLAAVARENIARALPKLKCKNVEVLVADALEYELPDEVTFVYFSNPFQGEIFAAVVQKILASLRRRPRELTIIYFDPEEEQALLDAGARYIRGTWGMRPTRKWSRENSIRLYKLGPVVDESKRALA